ncbi:hypothetical protein B7P43_G05746 [Cryptotermes secundus]|uniref:Mos1 transposase HTH domain-containing protein n=1 Tax=Cryptotermes secundus TaxID=105785 RepID=A0A2J7QTZ4_9NEOP|nr:hypothetical protein B7P43_G05746 [Cryptotermes secundus]
MEALIECPADREVQSVIKFLNAQSIALIEIHRQLCRVYGPNVMSKQMVHRWCRQFSAGRQSVHDEKRSGRPSIITDDLVELVRERITENHHVTVTELSSHVPQISGSLLHEIVTEHLLFRKFCARWVPKQLTPEHKTKCMEERLEKELADVRSLLTENESELRRLHKENSKTFAVAVIIMFFAFLMYGIYIMVTNPVNSV